ncbi:hypothetical protein AB0L53_42220 [Nonomuraea sp. NPDC052129]
MIASKLATATVLVTSVQPPAAAAEPSLRDPSRSGGQAASARDGGDR